MKVGTHEQRRAALASRLKPALSSVGFTIFAAVVFIAFVATQVVLAVRLVVGWFE